MLISSLILSVIAIWQPLLITFHQQQAFCIASKMEASYGVELYMMTSSNGIIFRVTARCAGNSSVSGEIPLTKASDAELDVFYDQRLNTRLSKQSWGWWFETLSRSLWRYCNEPLVFKEYWKAQNPKPSPFLHNRNSSFCVQSGHMMTLEFISSYH